MKFKKYLTETKPPEMNIRFDSGMRRYLEENGHNIMAIYKYQSNPRCTPTNIFFMVVSFNDQGATVEGRYELKVTAYSDEGHLCASYLDNTFYELPKTKKTAVPLILGAVRKFDVDVYIIKIIYEKYPTGIKIKKALYRDLGGRLMLFPENTQYLTENIPERIFEKIKDPGARKYLSANSNIVIWIAEGTIFLKGEPHRSYFFIGGNEYSDNKFYIGYCFGDESDYISYEGSIKHTFQMALNFFQDRTYRQKWNIDKVIWESEPFHIPITYYRPEDEIEQMEYAD